MRRMAALGLAVVLAIGGCPGGSTEIPSAVTILAAGTYEGTLACTVTVSGQEPQESDSPVVLEVTEQGQLYVNDVPYYEGATGEETDSQSGVTSSLTINTITEDEASGTVTIAGTGSTSNPQRTYQTTRDITLVQTDDNQIQVTDVLAGQASDASFEVDCSGTVSR